MHFMLVWSSFCPHERHPHTDNTYTPKYNTESRKTAQILDMVTQGCWVQLRQQRCHAAALAQARTSTTLLADTATYCTLLSFRLKLKWSKVRCWQDSNGPSHAKIPPTLHPDNVNPDQFLAIWAGLRPQGRDILCHHLSPVLPQILRYLRIYSTYLHYHAVCLLALRPLSAQPPIGWERGRK